MTIQTLGHGDMMLRQPSQHVLHKNQSMAHITIAFSAVVIVVAAAALIMPLSAGAAAAPAPAPAAPAPVRMPPCYTTCGNISVAYPFGMGPSHCYHSPGFNLTCDHTSNPLRLILMGCNVRATLKNGNITMASCSSLCEDGVDTEPMGSSSSSLCTGMVCCKASIVINREVVAGKPVDISSYDVHLELLGSNRSADKEQRPVHVFVASAGWFEQTQVFHQLSQTDGDGAPSEDATAVAVYLNWEVLIGNDGTELHSNSTSSQPGCPRICKSHHSDCRNGTRGGYRCSCKEGYEGNPYITDGCKGGGKFFKGKEVVIGVSSGADLILLVFIAFFIYKKLKHRRAQILKRKFFEQNRRQLLQQLVSQRSDIAERMIISLEELEKATNNFDKSHELGGGGHGTVYKGILSDLHVVAIKKSKKIIQKEIDEFINEVAILSQINHRNVVKLYGCCLETEVPMLVYVFISNGTLYDHLHVEGPRSLSWDDRLRIAIEAVKSLAYLHSTASTPIVHRDVKTVNILLDDTLTAKVADFGASRYISIEKSGLTTMVQGTIGYLDPMYFYTGSFTEKSDVYSFGVMLVELLTRKKPFSYISPDGEGLAAHFVKLFVEGNLLHILDPQVMDEGGKDVEEVAALAVACVKLRGEYRPTMRQVELTLENLLSPKQHVIHNVVVEKSESNDIAIYFLSTEGERSGEGSTRQYSMEEEFQLSARFPR